MKEGRNQWKYFQKSEKNPYRPERVNNNIRLFHISDKPQILTRDNYMKYNTNIRKLIKVKNYGGRQKL